MYKSTDDPALANAKSAESIRAREKQARVRLAVMLVVPLTALIATMLVRGYFMRISTPGAFRGELLSSAVMGPILIGIFWLTVSRRFRACQEALHSNDMSVFENAIRDGLRLPLRSFNSYNATWILGMIPVIWVGSLVSGSIREQFSAVMTDVVPFLIAMSAAIFTIVEAHCRPVLRRLYDAAGHDVNHSVPYRFGLAPRVTAVITITIISATMLLSSGAIGAAIGAEGEGRGETAEIFLQIPVLALMVASITWAITTTLNGSIKELARQVDAVAGGDLTRRGAVTSTV